MTLQNVLERIRQEDSEGLDERLISLIAAAHDQYQRYFLLNYQEGNEELPGDY